MDKKVALKEQKVVAKQTIKIASSNVAESVCANQEGKGKVDCHTGVKTTVKKYLTTVKKAAQDTIKSCQCSDKASSECGADGQCKSYYVSSCGKDCLSNSKSYHKVVETHKKELIKKVCGKGGDEDCVKTVKDHCDDASKKLKKVAVKVTQVKTVHKEVISKKEKVEKKIKDTIVKKEKKQIKKTVKDTCDKVAKAVCSSATGDNYVNCHKSTVTAVKHFLKKS